MAPPYRKSCSNCVKSKRRCDHTSGNCQRCTTKHLVCSLNRNDRPDLRNNVSSQTPVNSDSVGLSVDFSDYPFENFSSFGGDLWNNNGEATTFIEPSWLATLTPGPDLDIQWPSQIGEEELQIDPCNQFDDTINAAQFTGEPITITTGEIYYERVRFISRQFQAHPAMFLKNGQTPFIHRPPNNQPHPAVLQDALSSCALYSCKTEDNERMVFGDLSRKVRELVYGRRNEPTANELLASVQALLLYQIISLFDGDIRLRAEAEVTESTLIQWAEKLNEQTEQHPLRHEGSNSVAKNRDISWKEWVFKESCRRTILAAYMLQGIYSFLKYGYDSAANKVNTLSFTAQKALWNAQLEYEWERVFREKPHFQVVVKEWDLALNEATPEEFEDLGVMVCVALNGPAICESFAKGTLPGVVSGSDMSVINKR